MVSILHNLDNSANLHTVDKSTYCWQRLIWFSLNQTQVFVHGLYEERIVCGEFAGKGFNTLRQFLVRHSQSIFRENFLEIPTGRLLRENPFTVQTNHFICHPKYSHDLHNHGHANDSHGENLCSIF